MPKDIVATAFELIDAVVEMYLAHMIAPFLRMHETFYAALNRVLRSFLDSHDVPVWCTANFITYLRTVFVIPALLLLAWGHTILPSMLVVAVDFGDFLDGVVARYWVDDMNQKKSAEQETNEKDKSSRSSSPSSDADSFEVVTTGSPLALLSWNLLHRNRTYGGFVDAVCDKAFVIPCWISLLHTVPGSSYLVLWQCLVLVLLVCAETASGCIRFRAYFSSPGVPAPPVIGLDFSTSAVKADHIGKAKQTFEMVGTALFILPYTRYLGLVFLSLAVPLAYESVRRKIVQRVLYVMHGGSGVSASTVFDHKTLKFWCQVAAMGSRLVVGIVPASKDESSNNNRTTDMVLNACAVHCVSTVIAEAPGTVDLLFMERQGIDFVVLAPGQSASLFVTDEVLSAKRVLAVGDDGTARPVEPKSAAKQE